MELYGFFSEKIGFILKFMERWTFWEEFVGLSDNL